MAIDFVLQKLKEAFSWIVSGGEKLLAYLTKKVGDDADWFKLFIDNFSETLKQRFRRSKELVDAGIDKIKKTMCSLQKLIDSTLNCVKENFFDLIIKLIEKFKNLFTKLAAFWGCKKEAAKQTRNKNSTTSDEDDWFSNFLDKLVEFLCFLLMLRDKNMSIVDALFNIVWPFLQQLNLGTSKFNPEYLKLVVMFLVNIAKFWSPK